jgi:hypothetical protein
LRVPLWLGRLAGFRFGSAAGARDLGDFVFGRWRRGGPEVVAGAAVVGAVGRSSAWFGGRGQWSWVACPGAADWRPVDTFGPGDTDVTYLQC